MTKERPILFSGAMVRAILRGEKTQTRRALRIQPLEHHWRHIKDYELSCKVVNGISAFVRFRHFLAGEKHLTEEIETFKCPHGRVGDHLWVRETWSHTGTGVWTVGDTYLARDGKIVYRADADIPGAGWFPSIHMPRVFSRITLEITDVRVERLQDISEEDARAEGTIRMVMDDDSKFYDSANGTFKCGFAGIWAHINGAGSWDANPWVWALSFRQITQRQIEEERSSDDETAKNEVLA